jgi:hypothetical protein
MATLNIGGHSVRVDDSFLKMSSDQQAAAVEEIAASLNAGAKAPAPAAQDDKYKADARKLFERSRAAGASPEAGIGRLYGQGATLEAADEIMAGLSTPFEMIRQRTFNPIEAYKYAKAQEDLALEEGRKKAGWVGTAAEITGGIGSGIGLARGGITAARALAPNAGLVARSGASAADAGILGGVSGFMSGDGLEDRAKKGAIGGVLGAGIGGVAPTAMQVASGVASPILSNVRARWNPQGFAETQVARGVMESGRAPQQIMREVVDANAAGQPFTVADAMGHSGQRMLSTVARAPGAGRTAAVEFLENRQAGQGARLTQQVDDALGSSGTARKSADELISMARNESSPFYKKALERNAVWSERLQEFFDDPVTKRGLREGIEVQRLESLALGKKFDPKDYAITNFNEAGDPIISGVPNMRTINLVKKGFDNILEGYRDSTTGRLMLDERGRAIDAVRRSFLSEVDSINPDYKRARQLFSGPAQVRDAITTGGEAVSRGRAADNLAQFNLMGDAQKQGHRIGYADKLAERFERPAQGTNKARTLTSDKAQAELGAQSLYQGPELPGRADQLNRRLARENTMFDTRQKALGGSNTKENFADDDVMGIDPTIIGQLFTGNFTGAARSALTAGSNLLTGNTPAVREHVARILLQRGQNGASPQQIQSMIDDAMRRIERMQVVARMIGRGGSAGLAVTPSAISGLQ